MDSGHAMEMPVLISLAASEGMFRVKSAGSTVVPSHLSPADLTSTKKSYPSSFPTASAIASAFDVVVLVRLHVRLNVPCRHQTNLMTLLAQSPAKIMRATAGFHANQTYLQIRRELQQLFARTLLPRHDSRCVEGNEVKNGRS